jgi:hypothetical protein
LIVLGDRGGVLRTRLAEVKPSLVAALGEAGEWSKQSVVLWSWDINWRGRWGRLVNRLEAKGLPQQEAKLRAFRKMLGKRYSQGLNGYGDRVERRKAVAALEATSPPATLTIAPRPQRPPAPPPVDKKQRGPLPGQGSLF